MRHKFVRSVVLVFCTSIYIISAKEVREDDELVNEQKLTNSISANEIVNKELKNNGSELERAQANECKCKNGKCMRLCDISKTVPCLNQNKVCVCSPGFAEKDGECKYCDCGKDSNCTFVLNFSRSDWRKRCLCPKGYYDYFGFCKAKCSDELPCQNGGRCVYETCICPYDTKGYLCEELICTKCGNRLEVDCLYNLDKETSVCSCKNSSLFYDYDARICKPCPCVNGECEYEIMTYSKKLKCRCNPDHQEYNGYCKKCDCGFGGACELNFKGEKICHCEKGYYEREGYCQPCNCFGYDDTDTECEQVDNVKRCFCQKGFRDVGGICEDGVGVFTTFPPPGSGEFIFARQNSFCGLGRKKRDINECETNNTCHPSTTCFNMFGSFYCQCPSGYEGSLGTEAQPGEVCEDIDECSVYSSCRYFDNIKCVNVPGSYKCECYKGYKPTTYDVDPIKTTCVNAKKSFVPAMIVLVVTVVLIVMSIIVHCCVKRRATRLN